MHFEKNHNMSHSMIHDLSNNHNAQPMTIEKKLYVARVLDASSPINHMYSTSYKLVKNLQIQILKHIIIKHLN